ncbi:MAG: YbfB/YjiJ family MFS transporter [Ancalomicrobiaceae bacterium]|nr:YbfB/YjiJ family MFS transporter [Ancalomicrobiaceae bacterium]
MKPPSPFAVCVAAATALAVAMGVGRFAFTPMLPLMVRDGGLDMAASPYLAAVNYLAYLVGGLTAARVPWAPATLARASLLGVAAVTAAMGATASLGLWLILRGLAGLFSGWALVGVSTWALSELASLGRPRLAAVVYAGVGTGLALAGLFCLLAARPGIPAARLWLELGGLTLAALVAPLILLRGGPGSSPTRPVRPGGARETRDLRLLTLAYGIFGFGYILPATFLPALARQIVDDPAIFGLVWPLFGAAAALSTLVAGAGWIQANRLQAWAICHGLMACGALLPALHPSEAGLAVSALLVGGTFVVVTMLGMQEARLRSPDHAAAALSRMTGAFALGQLAGPLAVSLLPSDGAGLDLGLTIAGLALLATVPLLWRLSLAPRIRS